MTLQFDESYHRYTVDNHVWPSVTQIIKPLYDWERVPNIYLEYARERGHAAHLACELHDKGTLDIESVDDVVMPYLTAYKRFLDETGFEPILIEQSFAHSVYGFAGTMDRLGTFRNLDGAPTCVLEIKATCQMHRATGVQLSGYRLLARDVGIDATLRYGVRLHGDGKYTLHAFADPLDDQQFLGMLTNHLWRLKNG